MPQTLWSEFQNLKELYANKKISENIKHKGDIMTKTKLNLKDLEKHIETMVEKKTKEINENKKTVKILLNLLNIIKLPAPTLEFSPSKKVKFFPLYF
ncbi:hypothetical protein EOM09_05990 [bacterium]|nr:hypothetical protein [bacterium]